MRRSHYEAIKVAAQSVHREEIITPKPRENVVTDKESKCITRVSVINLFCAAASSNVCQTVCHTASRLDRIKSNYASSEYYI